MISSSPSPILHSVARTSSLATFGPYDRHDGLHLSPRSHANTAKHNRPQGPSATPIPSQSQHTTSDPSLKVSSTLNHALVSSSGPSIPRRMVDAATQYSPPLQNPRGAATKLANLTADLPQTHSQILSPNTVQNQANAQKVELREQMGMREEDQANDGVCGVCATRPKRSTSDLARPPFHTHDGSSDVADSDESPSSKRARPSKPSVRLMPLQYETCNPKDLVILISSMLMELVRYNDSIPLRDGQLTRFHSRAPPGISVLDYLQRLTTHATLSPPILLSMVYYIDKLCALYPAFTISSLTVHRFLITSATVASKGLSDSFWTNKTYARVGGVSLKELALLELEFLWRVEWRIVPKPEVLVDYYKSLVERSDGYEIESLGSRSGTSAEVNKRDNG